MARNLIIVRPGAASLHQCWVDRGHDRSFDLLLCPYGATSFVSEPEHGIYVGATHAGLKWAGLKTLLHEWQGWRDYEYIALVDDDILASQADWIRFFDICAKVKARLAQPTLTQDSYFSHVITLQNKSYILRETTYVECMMPCFHRDGLADLLPTLAESPSGSGWGLEHLWAKRLGYKDIWIIDAVPMRHTRPVGGAYQARKAEFTEEYRNIVRNHDAPALMRSLSGYMQKGQKVEKVDGDNPDFLRLYLSGYWDLVKDNSTLFWRILKAQTEKG